MRRRRYLGNRSYLQQLIDSKKSGRWVWEAPKGELCVVTERGSRQGLAAASAAVEALTANGLAAAHAGAAPAITAVACRRRIRCRCRVRWGLAP